MTVEPRGDRDVQEAAFGAGDSNKRLARSLATAAHAEKAPHNNKEGDITASSRAPLQVLLHAQAKELTDDHHSTSRGSPGVPVETNADHESNGWMGRCGESKTPVVENFHFAGHLLRRACGVTGKVPQGGADPSHQRNDPPAPSIAEDSAEYQMYRLRRNPEVMEVLERLKGFSSSLLVDRQSIGGLCREAPCPKRALNGTREGGALVNPLQAAQDGYLTLFEDMLVAILKAQRQKSKVSELEV